MAEYKLTPVKKILSKKIKNEKGTPERVFKFSSELGILTKEELEILVKLKTGENIPKNDLTSQAIIRGLLQKGIIEKIEK